MKDSGQEILLVFLNLYLYKYILNLFNVCNDFFFKNGLIFVLIFIKSVLDNFYLRQIF